MQIELIGCGPGLAMMRSDTSPVKSHLESVAANLKNVSFSGSGNPLETRSVTCREQKICHETGVGSPCPARPPLSSPPLRPPLFKAARAGRHSWAAWTHDSRVARRPPIPGARTGRPFQRAACP